MKTTFKDIGLGLCEVLDYHRSSVVPQFGRSYIRITCPFCGATVTAYIWSLPSGKRCTCGAMHDNYGRTYRRKS